MRKADREIKGKEALTEILQKCDVCRLGLNTGGAPYIVPVNFGFEWEG
ncbi:MAG: pyridoxamine 5'-phosphate oxidase family protein, partial [Clostridiales Family XIII bacterium]|nr:pyridoxamine 5'-phosphate oxidase family protein [Clostridiales Family XIII bacterium]